MNLVVKYFFKTLKIFDYIYESKKKYIYLFFHKMNYLHKKKSPLDKKGNQIKNIHEIHHEDFNPIILNVGNWKNEYNNLMKMFKKYLLCESIFFKFFQGLFWIQKLVEYIFLWWNELPTFEKFIFILNYLTTWVEKHNEDDWKKIIQVLCYLRVTVRMLLTLEVTNIHFIHWWL